MKNQSDDKYKTETRQEDWMVPRKLMRRSPYGDRL